MNGRNRITSRLASLLLQLIVLVGILTTAACGQAPSPTPIVQPPVQEPPAETSKALQAEVTFEAEIPESTPADAVVDISILDEVTGLPLNAKDYRMQRADSNKFSIKLPLNLGTVVKYRYFLEGTPSRIEYTASGRQVRYRLIQIAGPEAIRDVISSWKDPLPSSSLGQVIGQVLDEATASPVPGLLVAAGGSQTFTASDGSFSLDDLPAGTHNLVVYSLDGRYRPFQQGATVVAGLTTPAKVNVSQAPLVNVTFMVTLPPENVVGLPVRMAGNLVTLGNTFADLNGGLSTVASRMPLLTPTQDGRYSLTLSLPAGTDLQYKYTLGDGFWNAELTAAGKMNLRELIVPEQDTTIEDKIETWRSPNFGPVSLEVKSPPDMPAGETVSIQLNPYDWTVPVPMWSLGDGRWLYILYNPLHMIGPVTYRFCRNDQCGGASTANLKDAAQGTLQFKPDAKTQSFSYEITSWTGWQTAETPPSVSAAEILPRGPGFTAGIEFNPNYSPVWLPYLAPNYQSLRSIGGNWVFLSPTWSYQAAERPTLAPNPAQDALWFDLITTAGHARNQGLKVGLFPRPNFPQPLESWWETAPRDAGWWNAWFEQYRRFILHHADLANQSGSSALIMGGDWLAPALPDGKMPDQSSSGVPQDADSRWSSLVQEIRSHFSGQILFAVPYPAGIANPPAFLNQVDAVYLLMPPPFIDRATLSEGDLEREFLSRLEAEISGFHDATGKPVILGLSFPSAKGSALGCVTSGTGQCVSVTDLDHPNTSVEGVETNLQEQVDLYNALLASMNSVEWITGVISRGYYPPVAVQDSSSSIHGKPAWDVLWYWFPKLLEAIP